jgi:hypothetical protein
MPHIYIDADGCPVKEEVYRVARRYDLPVTLVANKWFNTPADPAIQLEVVGQGFDEADDWIVDNVEANDIVITGDIPLADRCLKKGARALGLKGKVFTEESIGEVLATREILSNLREAGQMTGGPAPFAQKDRSRFLQSLDTMVNAALRNKP